MSTNDLLTHVEKYCFDQAGTQSPRYFDVSVGVHNTTLIHPYT